VPLTAQDVAEITRLLEESDFLELRIEHEGFKLTLKRAGARGVGMDGASPATPTAAAAPESWPAAASAAPRAPWPVAGSVPVLREAGGGPRAASDPSLSEVTAPLLGIFYRAARPGAEPYVQVGTVLQEDSIIGIIEVMKLMNSVRAEVRGTVVEILVEDGTAVEQGQVLLRVSRESGGG
jgi:acetyl-CoA carboxylase biotin carboxyl carrier protein